MQLGRWLETRTAVSREQPNQEAPQDETRGLRWPQEHASPLPYLVLQKFNDDTVASLPLNQWLRDAKLVHTIPERGQVLTDRVIFDFGPFTICE